MKRLLGRAILLEAPVPQLVLEHAFVLRAQVFGQRLAIRSQILEDLVEHLRIPVQYKVSLARVAKSGLKLRIFVLRQKVAMYVEMRLLHLQVDHVILLLLLANRVPLPLHGVVVLCNGAGNTPRHRDLHRVCSTLAVATFESVSGWQATG